MKISVSLLALFLVVIMFVDDAYCEADSAEQHVEEFYKWYINGDGNTISKDDREEIQQYVDGCVAKTIRILCKRNYFSVGYYTKSQDLWDEWLDVLVVHKEMKINDTTSVVPVSFKFSEDKQHHLIVFVKKEKDGWRITKVAGTENFYE